MGKGPVIDVGFSGDVDSFINDIKKKLGSVKGIGLDKAFDHDVADMIKMLGELQKAFNDIGKSKVNTTSFIKAQKEITDKITLLEERTSALENGMTALISTMSKADGGKFSKELQDIITNMSTLHDVTIGVTDVIQKISDVNVEPTGLEETLALLQSIMKLKSQKVAKKDMFEDFKSARNRLVEIYNEISTRKNELRNLDITSDSDRLRIAELQKEIIKLGYSFKSIFRGNYSNFTEEFDKAKLKSKLDGTEKSFENIAEIVESTMARIKDEVRDSIADINDQMKGVELVQTQNDEHQLTVPLVISTKESTLLKRAEEIIDAVSNSLQDNPIKVSIVLASAWGTRKSNEIFKEFQNQIDNLSKSTDVSELRKLADDISHYFGNEIELKFVSNFDKESKAIYAGIRALQEKIGKKFKLNPKIEFSETEIKRLQGRLNKVTKNLVLTIQDIQLSDGAVQKATKLKEKKNENNAQIDVKTLSAIIDAMVTKITEVNKYLDPTWKTLVDIKNILNDFPLNDIVSDVKELVQLIQKAYGLLDKSDLSNWSDVFSDDNIEATSEWVGKTYEELEKCKKQEERWLNQCKEGSDAYNKRKKNIEEINKLLAETIKYQDFGNFSEEELHNAQSGDVGYTSTSQSVKQLSQEDEQLKSISNTASEAAEAKTSFADANKEVLNSIIESLKGLDNEGKAFENINKLLNNVGSEKGGNKVEKLKTALQDIYDLLNQNVDDNSLVRALENLAKQGTSLESLATVLKASKKELLSAQEVLGNMNSDELDDLLNNHAQEIVGRARQELLNLGGENSQFVNISNLQKTKDGFIEIVGLIKTADNQMQEFTLHTKDGIHMQNVGMSENTAKIAKQMKIYAQVQAYFDKMKEQGKNVTDNGFFDKDADPEVWKMIVEYAKQYHKELGDIQNITMQTRQNGTGGALFESFSINGKNGHLTVGREGETVGSSQQLLNVEELTKRIDSLSKKTKDYYLLLEKKSTNTANELELKYLNDIETEYEDIIALVNQYKSILEDSTKVDEVFIDRVEKMTMTYNNAQQKYVDKVSQSLNDALTNPRNKDLEFSPDFMNSLGKAIDKVRELQELIDKHGTSNTPWSEEEIGRVQELREEIDKTNKSIKDNANILAKSSEIDKLLSKISNDLNDNSAMSPALKTQYKQLRDEIDSIRNSTEGLNKVDLNALRKQFMSLHEQMERAGNTGKGFFEQFKKAVTSRSVQFLSRYFSFQDIIRYGRQAFNAIYDLDTALIDLKKTTTMSTQELNEFYLSSNNIAKSMGVTTHEIIQQAANWSRLGYSTKEAASTMAELSSQFASISPGMDVDLATDGLVSSMKAFHIDVANVESEIMDVINRIGNTMATTNEEVVEMLKRSSAAMNAANNDIRQTIALESAAVQITRNAETTGTAFRTISMRIRGKSLPPYAVMYMLCA